MAEHVDGIGTRWTRRGMLQTAAGLAAAGAALGAAPGGPPGRAATKGRVNHSACRWCYGKIPLDDLCVAAKGMGLVGLDLIDPKDFPTLKKHGLIVTMTTSHPLGNGLCDPKFHEASLKAIRESINATAAEGWRNVICFSGNARGIDRKAGLDNCARALEQLMPEAEKAGVTVQMELLNSKVDHKDYMCDNTTWGIELVEKVGSDRFKLLYDIYHMQIMEGDVIRTIRAKHKAFGHYHTGGNPGRHEIDETQELFYPAIARAIVETGFQGYLAQEFLPTRDPLVSLAQAVAICDV